MREQLPEATIRDAVLEFLRERDDVVLRTALEPAYRLVINACGFFSQGAAGVSE